MNKLIFPLVLFLVNTTINAQQSSDSIKQKTVIGIKEKFPRARFLNFEYGQSLSRNFDSKLFNEDFEEGKIKNQHTFNATLNLPIYVTRKWSLSSSLNYALNKFEFNNIDTSTLEVFEKNGAVNFHNYSVALSSTYFSSLFKKPVIYNASLIVDGNEEGLERLKGFLGFTFIMKRTANTTITLGGIMFVDPTSQIPFFPTFSYNHKFNNSKWEIDFILPQRLLFRRFVGENGRFSIGSTFGSAGFYVNVDNPSFADTFEYSQLEVKTGIVYEHRINNYLIGTFSGGLQNFISNRLTEKGEPTKDYIYKNNQDATGYFQIGVSIDPFAKRKK